MSNEGGEQMQLGRSKVWNQVGRKIKPKQTSQVNVTISVELNSFGVLRASDMIYFESESEVDQLEGLIVPAATPVDEIIDQIGNAVVLG